MALTGLSPGGKLADPQVEKLSGLKRRLVALLLFVYVLIVGAALLYYRHYAGRIELDKSELLASIAKAKTQQILDWRADRTDRIRSLLESPILAIYLRRLAEVPEDKANLDLLRRRLESFVRNNGYTGAALIDQRGKILASAGKLPVPGCPEVKRLLKAPGVLAGPLLGEIHRDLAGASDMHVVGLALRSGSVNHIFLAAGINLAAHFYPLLKTWPTASPSAETLIARREGGRVLYLNDLRNKKDAALNLSLPLETEGLPEAAALRGFEGIIRGKDYRGVPVLAYAAPVPGTDWAIVSKMDEAEVLADLRAPTVLLLLLVLALLGGAAAAFFLILHLQEEEHLKDSEHSKEELLEKVRELAEAQRLAHIGNWTLDLATNKLYWSDEIYRIFELDKDKFGASYGAFLNAIHPEDRDAVHKAYTDSLENRSTYNITHRLLLKDGKIKYVTEFCETFYGGDGRALRSVGTVQDVTAIKDVEREFDHRDSILNSLLNSLSGGVFMVEVPSGKPLYANRAAERLLGRGVLAAASKENLSEVYRALRVPGRVPYPPEEMPILRGMQGETSNVDDMLVVRPDGTETFLEIYGTPVRDSQGVVWASLVSFQDITERKRAEAERGLNERRIESLLKLSSYRGGEKELLDLALEEALKVTGSRIGYIYRYSEETRKFVLNTWSREVMPECKVINPQTEYELKKTGIWGEVVRQRKSIIVNDYDAPDPLKKGCPKDHVPLKNWLSVPIFSGGKIVGVVGIANRDGRYDEADVRQLTLMMDGVWRIMAQTASERQRDELNVRLKAKNDELENFLYITTHDLRTPLVNIQGFSQNVRSYFQEIVKLLGEGPRGGERIKKLTDEKIPEALAYVQEGSRKMEALISALLKVSRAGRVELKPEKIEMEPLLRKIMDAMRFQLEEAGAVVEVSPGLPACCADPGAVSQIFSNLLDNAVKYRDPVRPLRVRITADKKNDFAVYSVADNGRGISGRDLKSIWAVFARPLSARQRGEGIGLPMVKRIAERSGGGITAESKEGSGSVFRVELPAA